MSNSKNTGPIIHHIRGGKINLSLMVTVMVTAEVVLVLGQPTFTPIKSLILAEKGIMRDYVHIRVIVNNSLWCNFGVGIIQLNIPIVLDLVFLMVMV